MRLVDGTIVNVSDDAIRKLIQAAKDEADDGEALVKIVGYQSSTGRVTNVTLHINYDYMALVNECIKSVKKKKYSKKTAKGAFTKANFDLAKSELLDSLDDSLSGDNALDNSSKASMALDSVIRNIRVGLSSGNVMLRGIIKEYEIVEDVERKKRKSSAKTLAKKFLSEGTYRAGTVGSIRTYSLSQSNFDYIEVFDQKFPSSLFKMDSSARRVRGGKRTAGKVDCVFVIDTTGSNWSNQPAIRKSLDKMLQLSDGLDLQVGFIFQGDYCDGDELVTIYPMQELSVARRILARSHDTGGGDYPEAYEVGLHSALGLRFRKDSAAVVVMVTDAYPHEFRGRSLSPYTFTEKVHEASEAGVVVHYVFTDSGDNDGLRWAKGMSALQEESDVFELSNREYLPYALSAIMAGEAGEIEEFETRAKKMDVLSAPIEAAIRIFKGKGGKGASTRAAIRVEETTKYKILATFTNDTGDSMSVKELRKEAGEKKGTVYFELTKTKTYKKNFVVGSVEGKKLAVQDMSGSKSSPTKIGPDASSKVYILASSRMKLPAGATCVIVDQ